MKQTYSTPITVYEPDKEGNTKVIASSGREVAFLKLVASGGSAHIELYDNPTTANPTDLVWVMDASTSCNDVNPFPNPLFFKKGIYAKLTQGAGFNAKLCLAYISSQA